MKRKLSTILILLLAVLTLSACNNKEESKKESEEKEVKLVQDLKVTKEENGEIVEGTLEGYTFKVTDEVTDRVKIEMEDGSLILLVLSNESTPITIKNFKKLVSEGLYDGLIFHRVIKDFMIQGGDPTGTGYGDDSVATIKGEFTTNGVKNTMSHTRGVISMARSNDPDSASSQFFIVHEDSPHLDGSYAAFGKVFAGLDAVDEIANVNTDSNDRPLNEQKIKTIKFITIEKAE